MRYNRTSRRAPCRPCAALLTLLCLATATRATSAAVREDNCGAHGTCVNALYQKLALINGGPVETGGTIVIREPLICFPRGASRLSGHVWSSDKKRPAAIIREIKELGALLVAANRDSGRPSKSRLLVRVSGFADSEGGDDSNLKLSFQRAQTIAALLRQSAPGVPLALEIEGRGQAKANSGAGGACADPARPATEAAGEPAPQPSHRRVEIEILSAALTHASAPSPESDDMALRLFPEGSMPYGPFRVTLAEGDLKIDAISKACRTPIAAPASEAPANRPPAEFEYPSTPWVELARPGGSVDSAKYPLHQFEPNLSGSFEVVPVRRLNGARTTDGVRIVLRLAKAESTPYLIPGYWAVALHLATLPQKLTSSVGNPAVENPATKPWERIVDCYASIAAGRTASKLVDESHKLLNGQIVSEVVSRLPKTIDGMMLHTHRADRNFHFFDLHPGMSLRFKSTSVDPVSRTMQPGAPLDLATQADPIDPYALVPGPRKVAAPRGRAASDLFLAYMLSGRLNRPSSLGAESAEAESAKAEHANAENANAENAKAESAAGAAVEAGTTLKLGALASHVVFEDLLQQGVVRVFLPRNLRQVQTIATIPSPAIYFSKAPDSLAQNPATLIVAAQDLAALDKFTADAHTTAFDRTVLCKPEYQVACAVALGGLTYSPNVKIEIGGQDRQVPLGARLAHVLPADIQKGCFEPIKDATDQWPPGARLGKAVTIELGGLPAPLIIDRKDCRLLGLPLTEGSRISW